MTPPKYATGPIDYDKLQETLSAAKSDEELFNAVVNEPFTYKVEMALLFLGIIVLLLVNKKSGLIDRVALADTEFAKGTTDMSVKPFEDIKIPLDQPDNLIAKAIRTGESQLTSDWFYLFTPALTPQEARFNQAGGGIGCSLVYPLREARDGGALIFSYYEYPERIGETQYEFMHQYSSLVADQLKRRTGRGVYTEAGQHPGQVRP